MMGSGDWAKKFQTPHQRRMTEIGQCMAQVEQHCYGWKWLKADETDHPPERQLQPRMRK
jgi:hypothetical protein